MNTMISLLFSSHKLLSRVFIILCIVIFMVYGKSIWYGFVYFDDHQIVLNNHHFLSQPGNILKAFTTDVFVSYSQAFYRPVMTISLMIDAWLSGTNPIGYHITNILIHCLVSWLVFVLFWKLGHGEISLVFSIIFAIHPALAQAVAWIPGRNDSLMALWVLMSYISFIKTYETRTGHYTALHIATVLAAVFTKESAFMLIPLCLAHHFLIEKKPLKQLNIYLLEGWIIIIGLWLILRTLAFNNPVSQPLKDTLSSLFTYLGGLSIYLGAFFFPLQLSVLPHFTDIPALPGLCATAGIVLLVMYTPHRNVARIIFGLLWYSAFILPSFAFLPSTGPYLLEHRMYLAIIGIFMVLAETPLKDLLIRYHALSLTLLILLSIETSIFLPAFHDRIAFWKNAVRTSPTAPLAQRNLGAMYYLDNDLDQALTHFVAAGKLNPFEPMVHNNIGLVLMHKGNFSEAEKAFQRELEINPLYDDAYYNIGLLYVNMEKLSLAETYWLKGLSVNPNSVGILKSLRELAIAQKDYQKADQYTQQLQQLGIPLK